jgi:hypothetical protein
LNRRGDGEHQIQKFSAGNQGHSPARQFRRPFWLTASKLLVLTASAAIAFFFLVWGVFHEGDEETPLVAAGISASLVLGGAFSCAKFFLRKARNRFLLIERNLRAKRAANSVAAASARACRQTQPRERTRQSSKTFSKKAKPRGF